MPTKSQESWASSVWSHVLHELEFVPLDIKTLSVKTRPEVNDFGREFDILEWPSIEV